LVDDVTDKNITAHNPSFHRIGAERRSPPGELGVRPV
jgi:hypothetical protein